jgi:hypothetical protein
VLEVCVKLLKGCAQAISFNDGDGHRVFTYTDEPGFNRLNIICNDGTTSETWWEKGTIAGRGNENFNNFILWFEYE